MFINYLQVLNKRYNELYKNERNTSHDDEMSFDIDIGFSTLS